MSAAGVVMIIIAVAIVAALVVYLVGTIIALAKIKAGLDDAIAGVVEIIEKSAPVEEVVNAINATLDAGVDVLEGLLVKKAGIEDAMGLLEGLYPGASAAGLRNFPGSSTVLAPRIGEVYTRGTLTLARLGREAPVAAASPNGPALRDAAYGTLSARALYPELRQTRPAVMPRSPVIGTDSPVQYDPDVEVGGPRRQMPAAPTATHGATAPAGDGAADGATATATVTVTDERRPDADTGAV